MRSQCAHFSVFLFTSSPFGGASGVNLLVSWLVLQCTIIFRSGDGGTWKGLCSWGPAADENWGHMSQRLNESNLTVPTWHNVNIQKAKYFFRLHSISLTVPLDHSKPGYLRVLTADVMLKVVLQIFHFRTSYRVQHQQIQLCVFFLWEGVLGH